MPNTYKLISSSTVGSGGTASVTLSSIPGTYTDLLIKCSVSAATSNGFLVSINGSAANLTYKLLEGDGAAATSSNGSSGRVGYAFSSSTTFSNIEIYLPNYASATNKAFSTDAVSEQNASTAYADLTASLWSQTTAITSLGFSFSSGNIREFSTIYLYGIKNS